MPESQYEHIVVRGGPEERGRSHGEQARSKIHRCLEYYERNSMKSFGLQWEESLNFSRIYLPAIEKYHPSGLLEMKGIAAGAEVSLEEILVLNARFDMQKFRRIRSSECTSLALLSKATINGDVIVAQNWDMNK